MQVFKSRIDAWLLALLLLVIAVSLFAAAGSLRTGNWLAALMALGLGAGLPLWLLLTTRYIVHRELLEVKSGPFTWRISLSAITAVEASSNPVSSPALSLDRLAIRYDNGRTVLVSPADKTGFRAAIGQPEP